MYSAVEKLQVLSKSAVDNYLKADVLPIPEGLEVIKGDFKGQEVTMHSKAWQKAPFRVIRYTGLFMEGRIETFNFVLYPYSHFDAPIFASDWVVSGERLRVAVIDAMPLFMEEDDYYDQWVRPFLPLHLESKRLAPVYERKLSWSTKFLGPAACLATDVSKDSLSPLVDLWSQYLNLYLEKTSQLKEISSERQKQVEDWHATYNSEHLMVENKRNPYMVYFGSEIGERYNREFLFSSAFGG